jgi:ParB family chromosome partitioning protein
MAVLETKMVPLKDLSPFPGNPRKGNVPVIEESLRAHGQYKALVVNKPTMQILVGNHTWLGLNGIGAEDALVHFVDVDEDEARRIVLVDNRSQDLADYDDSALARMLLELPDLEGTGFDDESLEKMLARLDAELDAAPATISEMFEVLVSCDSEADQVALLERLTEEGRQCRALLS